jgi:hypothetical protein
MSYFPRPPTFTDVPEEIFFSVLKYLHPGATWLFCRQVSKSWKVHVDCNIERYIKHHNCLLASERARVEELCQFGETSDHLLQRLNADSLYVEVRWTQFPGDAVEKSSSLVLRFKEVELPMDVGVRDSNPDNWDEKVTFMAEENLSVYGHTLSILRIDHFMFPGFSPAAPDRRTMSDPFKMGTHSVNYGEYNVEYTLSRIDGFTDFSELSIHSITVPVRSLMTFSTPHVVDRERVRSGSRCKLRDIYFFNNIADERLFLPENILAERHREECQQWNMNVEPLCEMSFIKPMEKEALPEMDTPGMELATSGVGKGQENWGKYLTISNFSDNETLVELDDAWPDHNALPSVSTPPVSRDGRPNTAGGIADIHPHSEHRLRRISSYP